MNLIYRGMHNNCTNIDQAEPVRFAAKFNLRRDMYPKFQGDFIDQNTPPTSFES